MMEASSSATTTADFKLLISSFSSRLRTTLKDGGLGVLSRHVMDLVSMLVECYVKLMERQNGTQSVDQETLALERIEYNLYKDAYRVVVKYYREEIRSISHVIFKRRTNDAYLEFLNQAIVSFAANMSKYTVAKSPSSSRFRYLNILGDLERYKAGALSLHGRAGGDFDSCSEYYTRAIYMNRHESDVNPHNQLAAIASEKGDQLVQLYHHCRALTTRCPMITIGPRGNIVSAPLKNIFGEFKRTLYNASSRSKNERRRFRDCDRMCSNFICFHAHVFDFVTPGKGATQHEVNSTLRKIRANVKKQMKVLLRACALAPRLVSRMLFVCWFTIMQMSTQEPSPLMIRDTNASGTVLHALRRNAWSIFVELLSIVCESLAQSTRPSEHEDTVTTAGDKPTQTLLGKRAWRMLSAVQTGIDLLSTSLFCKDAGEATSMYAIGHGAWPEGVQVPAYCNFWEDCDAVSQRLLWTALASFLNVVSSTTVVSRVPEVGHVGPRTQEELELYGFPPVDKWLSFPDSLAENHSELLIDGDAAIQYRMEKFMCFGALVHEQQDRFFRCDTAVCCLVQTKEENAPPMYSLYSIESTDRPSDQNTGAAGPLAGLGDASTASSASLFEMLVQELDDEETVSQKNESSQDNSQVSGRDGSCEGVSSGSMAVASVARGVRLSTTPGDAQETGLPYLAQDTQGGVSTSSSEDVLKHVSPSEYRDHRPVTDALPAATPKVVTWTDPSPLSTTNPMARQRSFGARGAIRDIASSAWRQRRDDQEQVRELEYENLRLKAELLRQENERLKAQIENNRIVHSVTTPFHPHGKRAVVHGSLVAGHREDYEGGDYKKIRLARFDESTGTLLSTSSDERR